MIKAYNDLPQLVKIILEVFFGSFIALFYRIFVLLEGKMDTTKLLIIILIWLLGGFAYLWIIDLITVSLHNEITFLC